MDGSIQTHYMIRTTRKTCDITDSLLPAMSTSSSRKGEQEGEETLEVRDQ